jgi:hypothetical protein
MRLALQVVCLALIALWFWRSVVHLPTDYRRKIAMRADFFAAAPDEAERMRRLLRQTTFLGWLVEGAVVCGLLLGALAAVSLVGR